ncbi:hypothetical protein [Arsenicibacter rosenii]|nr:hypothetical protein [Arsenicibacter rosenii]
MSLLFWYRKKKDGKSGTIQARVTYKGEREEIGSTHITCTPEQWDRTAQHITGSSVWAKEQNMRLKRISDRIWDIERSLHDEGLDITAALIKSRCMDHDVIREQVQIQVKGKTITKTVTRRLVFTFSDLADLHLEAQRARVARGKLSQATVDIQENYVKNITDWLKSIKKDQLPASSITEKQADTLMDFLLEGRVFKYSHVEKHLKHLRAVLKWAANDSRKYIKRNPLAGYVIEADDEDPDTTHLTHEQLQRLIDFDFFALGLPEKSAIALDRERDSFVFNCFTGMHHADYTSKKYTIEEEKGEYWLQGRRGKTKKPFFVKLLEPAVAIYKKYGSDLTKLPSKSNQRRNDHLKIIAAHVGLPPGLSTKISRKTFADMALNELMVPIEDVAQLLGLTTTKRLRHYVRPRRNRIRNLLTSWHDIHPPKAA